MHGIIATMSALRHTKHVRTVCDMTIAYVHGNNFMQAPSSWQRIPTADLAKGGYRFYIHDDRYGTNELPESGLSKWLKEGWFEKMGRLEMLRDKLAVERNGKRRTCYVNEARKAKAPPTHDKLESARRSLEINC